MIKQFIFAFLIVLTFSSCKDKNDMTKQIEPPIAKIQDTVLEIHGDKRIDPYFWMNQRDHKDVLDYLNAENDYYNAMTAHTKDLQEVLFTEMKSRIKEDDVSVPFLSNGYYYQTLYETGKDYPVYIRRKGSLDAEKEVMFDCNQMAKGHNYFNLGTFSVSPDNKYVAYATDVVSRRIYTIKIKDLTTGKDLEDQIEGASNNIVWANDSKTFFYSKKNPQTLRTEKIFKHTLGSKNPDELVYFEKDDTFSVALSKTKSKKYLVIDLYSTLTTEVRFLDADNPNGKFNVFQDRKRGLEYSIDHHGNEFFVRTNHGNATNFKIMKTPVSKTTVDHWEDVVAHRDDYLIEDFELFKDFFVVEERHDGLNKLRIMSWDKKQDYYLPFDIETYTVSLSNNHEYDTKKLRYAYQSLATPSSIIDFDMVTKEKTILKESEVLGGKFDKNNFEEKRIWATVRDGVKVPISIVYKKGIQLNGKNPVLQYGYGSYGVSMDPWFSANRLSLLDRGFVYALAHIRGGEDLGRQWYEDGKLLKKINTFTDFIDCSKFLIEQKYTSPQHLYAMGGSAGGLLMGTVINMAPELYNGVVASVPFVDVVTTMLDDTIPLTTSEYDEWGNPNDKTYYDYMKSYSPYDNVKNQTYPNLFVNTGYHDSQVQYWEPAKWVAKLRTMSSNKNIILFETNMDVGHSGASGRFESLKEVAKEYAFFLDLEKVKN